MKTAYKKSIIPYTSNDIKRHYVCEGVHYFSVNRTGKRVTAFLVMKRGRTWFAFNGWNLKNPDKAAPMYATRTLTEMREKLLGFLNA